MKVYYGHCQAIYDTPQEVRDVQTLERLGFIVVNPNSPEHVAKAKEMKAAGQADKVMDYFSGLVTECDAMAFRAMPSGAIPAGVAKEIAAAKAAGKPVFELPSSISIRVLSVEQTREYLCEIGQR